MSAPITVVCLGDSITFGQYIDPSFRWTTLVEDRAKELGTALGVRVSIVNQGVNGEQTRMALERFPEAVQDVAPQILTVQYGLNDCNCWQTDRGVPRVSERAFQANLLEMVARARHFGVEEIVLATNHRTLRRTRMPSEEVYEEANARYSALLREVAIDAGTALCDIRHAFEALTDDELAQLLLPDPDVLHLSVEGNRVYADTVWPYLEDAVTAVAARRGVEVPA